MNNQTQAQPQNRPNPNNKFQEAQQLDYLGKLLMPDVSGMLQIVTNLLQIILSWACVLPEMMLRWDMGARYFNVLRVVCGYVGYGLILTFGALLLPYGGDNVTGAIATPLFLVLPFLYGALALIHGLRIWWFWYRDIPNHSMSPGAGHLSRILSPIYRSMVDAIPPRYTELRYFFTKMDFVGHWHTYCYIDPLVFLLIGYFLYQSRIDMLAGIWFMLCAVALFVKNQLVYAMVWNRQMDENDARIEAQFRNADPQKTSLRETAGFRAIPAPMLKRSPIASNLDIAGTVQRYLRPDDTMSEEDPTPKTSPTGTAMPQNFAAVVAAVLPPKSTNGTSTRTRA